MVSEDDILPEFHDFDRVSGWYRQQVLKLRAAELAQTEFLLTLDPDVILCKPLCYEQLVIEGRALLEPEERRFKARWWRGAARTLGQLSDLTPAGMSVTPALLSRSICRQLFTDLGDKYQRSWQTVLLANTFRHWTEYTLYYLAGERHRMLETFHVMPPRPQDVRLFCHSNVWRHSEIAGWDPHACFGPHDPGLFAVLQSNSGMTVAAITHRLEGLVDVAHATPAPTWIRLRSLVEDFRRFTFGRV